jgi:hypothetical protein
MQKEFGKELFWTGEVILTVGGVVSGEGTYQKMIEWLQAN